MGRGWGLAAFAMASLASSSALARDWPDAGGYEIHEGDEFCFLTADYKGPGESTLSLAIRRDGTPVLMVLNYNWSAEKGEKYRDISFRLDGEEYGDGVATGAAISGKNGFMQPMNPDFLPHFVKSTYLHVYKADKLIDRLDLEGSAAAVAVVRRCVAYVDGLRRAEERERKRYEDLPTDPFSKK
jgi:periplasmic protein TonB